jgi:uncharacterized membrane protein YraQ (UPF0718 family)
MDFVHHFSHMFLEALPFFVVAMVVAALLETKINVDRFLDPIIKSRFSVLWASLMAGVLPGCACATVPLAEILKKKNANLATTGAFLLVSPLLGPHTVILTYAFLGLKFTVFRIVAAILGGVLIGFVFSLCEKKGILSMPEAKAASCCSKKSGCGTNEPLRFWPTLWDSTKTFGGYFALGIAIAALLKAVVPMELIPTYLGSGVLAILVAVFMGIPIYVCEGEEIPITKALLHLGLAPGAGFAFMMGAVGTCIPTMLMAKKVIGGKPIVIYASYFFVFAFLCGIAFSAI